MGSKTEVSPFLKSSADPTKFVTLAGLEVIDFSSAALKVDGLTEEAATIEGADDFGESGDVFRHIHWRPVICALWGISSARSYLVALCSFLLLRGKNARISYRGKSVRHPVPIGNLDTRKPAEVTILGNGLTYTLYINDPTDASRVNGIALTPERFKCIMRMYIITSMIKKQRFPSTTESIGYANMCKSLMVYHDELKLTRPPQKAPTGSKADPRFESVNPDYLYWKSIIAKIGSQYGKYFNVTAIMGGCISSKEIYQWDEEKVPGCIYWSGIHAMMTDAANKVKAESAPADTRNRLAHSSFYSDFKRKMTASNVQWATGG